MTRARTWGDRVRPHAAVVQGLMVLSRDGIRSPKEREFLLAMAQDGGALLAEIEAIPKDQPLPGLRAGVECATEGCTNTVWVASVTLWMERNRETPGRHLCKACLEQRPSHGPPIILTPRTPEQKAGDIAHHLGRVMALDAVVFAGPWNDVKMGARWASGRLRKEAFAWRINVEQLVKGLGETEAWNLIDQERARLGTAQHIEAVQAAASKETNDERSQGSESVVQGRTDDAPGSSESSSQAGGGASSRHRSPYNQVAGRDGENGARRGRQLHPEAHREGPEDRGSSPELTEDDWVF